MKRLFKQLSYKSIVCSTLCLTLLYWFADFSPNLDLSQIFSFFHYCNIAGRSYIDPNDLAGLLGIEEMPE
jgi:hypothetical protein